MSGEQVKARHRLAWGLDVESYVKHAQPELAPIAERLIAAADPAWGATALDLGCGPGTATLPLARRVGPGGSVLGVDLTAPMVAWAERAATKEGITNARFAVGDAEDLSDLGAATFDLVISNFGVIFAPDPLRMVQEVARVLKPGGVFAFTVWRPIGVLVETWAISDSISPPPPEGVSRPPEWGEDGAAERRLSAHFQPVEVTPLQAPVEYATVDIAWQRMKEGRPPFALAYGRLSMDEKRAVEARAREMYRKYQAPDGRVLLVRDAAIVRGVRREG